MQETGKNKFDMAMKRAMERTSIVPSIKSIEQGTWMPFVPVETLYETYIDLTNPLVNDLSGFRIAHDVWNAAKEYRNALIAIWTKRNVVTVSWL